jgi:hypothetical protein
MNKNQGNQRQEGECVSRPSPGGSAGGGVEKTPAGDNSINNFQTRIQRRLSPGGGYDEMSKSTLG